MKNITYYLIFVVFSFLSGNLSAQSLSMEQFNLNEKKLAPTIANSHGSNSGDQITIPTNLGESATIKNGWNLIRQGATTGTVQLPKGTAFVSISGSLYATNKSYNFNHNGEGGSCVWKVTPSFVSGCSVTRRVQVSGGYYTFNCQGGHNGSGPSCPSLGVCNCSWTKPVYQNRTTTKAISEIYVNY